MKLSSVSLRIFELHSYLDLDEIELDTPIWFLFNNYRDFDRELPYPLVKDLTQSKAHTKCYLEDDIVDTLWFQKLRQFLDKKNTLKVLNLYVH